MKSKEGPYLPKEKSNYHPSDAQLTNEYSPTGDKVTATNPVVDPIVVNNITTSEFDNTEEPLKS